MRIEDKYFVHLGHILAGLAQPEFGSQNDAALTARAVNAEEDLQDMDRRSVRYLSARTMRTDYYPITLATTTLFST